MTVHQSAGGCCPLSRGASSAEAAQRGLRVVLLTWRDSGHPEGGGSEIYAESVAAGLVARGHEVTLLTASYPGSLRRETRDGVRYLRAGGRCTVYLRAFLWLLRQPRARFDVVVDVQNGLPFLSRWATRRPVVVLCHHVHREQWHIVFGHTAAGRLVARGGWWVESRLAPRVYRDSRYVTVSEISKSDLVRIGVDAAAVTVVHNGAPAATVSGPRSPTPEILVLGRLVPHKQVEHAIRAAAGLRASVPGLRLTIAGHGWWEPHVRAEVTRLDASAFVTLLGHVDDADKQRLLGRAWVLATPSAKEGWGLCVVEAAAHGTPSVGYRGAGGLAESILAGRTGLLAEGEDDFAGQLLRLLTDPELREQYGEQARRHASNFSWEATTDAFELLLHEVVGRPGGPVELPGQRSESVPVTDPAPAF